MTISIKYLDSLWRKAVKLKWNYRSVVSGAPVERVHHIVTRNRKNIPEIIVWLYFIQRTGIERNQKETLMGEQTLKRESRRMRRYINLLFSNMTLLDRIKFALLGNYHKPLLRTENKLKDRKWNKVKRNKVKVV